MNPVLITIVQRDNGSLVVMSNINDPNDYDLVSGQEKAAADAIAAIEDSFTNVTVRWGFSPLAELRRELIHPEAHGHAVANELRKASADQ